MTEHHAISRRAFTLGLGLAALSPLASLPETATLGIPLRAAFADDAATASVSLDKFVIRLRPAGYFRTASVNQDGNIKGNVCHLFNDGTSSKLILEHVVTDTKNTNWYAIRTLLNFEEHKKTGYSIWSVDGDSDKDGKVIHVWSGEHDGKASRSFALDRQLNGTYIIRDRTNEEKDINYLAIEKDGKDQDNNKICHKRKSIPWELELVGYSMDKTNATVSSIDWITYSSYVDGPCWMSYVDGNKFLDELSIPGTHDSGTCSVDNDTEPNPPKQNASRITSPRSCSKAFAILIFDSERVRTPASTTELVTCSKKTGTLCISPMSSGTSIRFERKPDRSAHHARVAGQ